MNRTRIPLALAALALCFAGPSHASDVGEYEDWAGQPHEPFTHGEESLRQIREHLLREYYRSDITEEDLDRAAAQGMLSFIDAKTKGWNKLVSPAEYSELQTDLKGQLVGIGVLIDFDAVTGVVDVNGIIPHSPAAAADVREGDKILAVDGRVFKGLTIRDMAYAMRGKEGTQVHLNILRDANVIEKTITRARITYDPVMSMMLPDGILYLQIAAFVDTTPAGVRAALDQAAKGHVRGIVVDLRDNAGGILDSAIDTAQLFVPRGKLIAQVQKRGNKVDKLASKADPIAPAVPVAVLINGDSKSSAELMAAALRANLTAPLIGQKTFGKWSVQSLEELPNKYVMKYTVGLLEDPAGRSYEGEGVPPDIEVPMDSKLLDRAQREKAADGRLAADVQLRAAYNLLRLRK
ncbi:MAG: PDZ domain-containing protein [Deltaproteobacteria bacterium]|nr:PDZ domain-containing protein [Deltaproteobacteria bacterium]